MNSAIESFLFSNGIDFVRFVDLSNLPTEQTNGFRHAILFGIYLSPSFIQTVSSTPDYVKNLIKNREIDKDEFHLKELKTDRIADELEEWLIQKGFAATSQSEENLAKTGRFAHSIKSSFLPHKTLATIAGLGWIGKHNLLVTDDYGSALSMCSALTDAPLESIVHAPSESKCGTCKACQNVCEVGAIKGKNWNPKVHRDEIVDVYRCTTCLRCMMVCPYTQAYLKRKLPFIHS